MNISSSVVKGFLSCAQVDFQCSDEDAIFLQISERLPSLVVDQSTCKSTIAATIPAVPQSIPFTPSAFLEIARISPTDDMQLFLLLDEVDTSAKTSVCAASQHRIRLFNLHSDDDTYAFVQKDYIDSNCRENFGLQSQYSLSMQKEMQLQKQNGKTVVQLIQLFLANFNIDIAMTSHQLLAKLTFSNIGFSIQPLKTTNALKIQDGLVLEHLRIERRRRRTNGTESANSTLTTGYLTETSAKRISLIHATDASVYTTKLLGIWIECDKNVNDIYLWTLFTEYAKNAALKKANISTDPSTSISFLFVWFEAGRDITAPLNFLVTIAPNSMLKKSLQKASSKPPQSLIKFDFRSSRFNDVSLVENALNLTFQPQNPQQQQQQQQLQQQQIVLANSAQHDKSEQYSLSSKDHQQLRHSFNTKTPTSTSQTTKQPLSTKTQDSLISVKTILDERAALSNNNTKNSDSMQAASKTENDHIRLKNKFEKVMNKDTENLNRSSSQSNSQETSKLITTHTRKENFSSYQAKMTHKRLTSQELDKAKSALSEKIYTPLISERTRTPLVTHKFHTDLRVQTEPMNTNTLDEHEYTNKLSSRMAANEQIQIESARFNSSGRSGNTRNNNSSRHPSITANSILTIEQGKVNQKKTLHDQHAKINELEGQLLQLKDQLKMSKTPATTAQQQSNQLGRSSRTITSDQLGTKPSLQSSSSAANNNASTPRSGLQTHLRQHSQNKYQSSITNPSRSALSPSPTPQTKQPLQHVECNQTLNVASSSNASSLNARQYSAFSPNVNTRDCLQKSTTIGRTTSTTNPTPTSSLRMSTPNNNSSVAFFSMPKHERNSSSSMVKGFQVTPKSTSTAANIDTQRGMLKDKECDQSIPTMSSRVKPPMNPNNGSQPGTRKSGENLTLAGDGFASGSTHRIYGLSKVSSIQSVTTAASSADQNSRSQSHTRRSRSIPKSNMLDADLPRIKFDFSKMAMYKDADSYDESNYLSHF